ncbi:hypothetical protein FS749_007573 [Ceratobasidium sp. UAMH 11750]|nr:hypothetical protein FS749_007573 [Ceratobasidium sp. UAMH 11750]
MASTDPHDILVKSTQDPSQDAIPAHSQRLAFGSHAFQSMIEIGSLSAQPTALDGTNLPIVEVDERHELLVLLVNLLETPPELPPPTVNNQIPSSAVPLDSDPPGRTLPWPLVVTLLDMADKYDLSESILARLHAHVRGHAPSHPLQVYALASRLQLGEIASLASSFLLYPPMHEYPLSEIKALPSAASYHLLLVLQTHRIEKLKKLVATEPIFPYEYGACSKHGTSPARLAWEIRKTSVLDDLNAGSYVADMMQCDEQVRRELKDCSDCCSAWEKAVEMIRYKAGKVPREISQLPNDTLQP